MIMLLQGLVMFAFWKGLHAVSSGLANTLVSKDDPAHFEVLLVFGGLFFWLFYLCNLYFPFLTSYFSVVFYLFSLVGLVQCFYIFFWKVEGHEKRLFWCSNAERGFTSLEFVLGIGLLLLAIITIAPSLNADTLAYHRKISQLISDNGSMPVARDWFHLQLAGLGESITALGLVADVENLGASTQLVGLLIICDALRRSELDASFKWVFFVGIIFSPVVLFWIGSEKPSLLGYSVLFCSYLLILCSCQLKEDVLKPLEIQRAVLIIAFLGSFLVIYRVNFIVWLVPLFIFCFWVLMKRKFLTIKFCLLVGVIVTILLMPHFAWRAVQYGSFESLKNFDMVGLIYPKTDAFQSFISHLKFGFSAPTIFELFVPLSIGGLTASLGPAALITVFLTGLAFLWRKVPLSVIFLLIGSLCLGLWILPFVGRFWYGFVLLCAAIFCVFGFGNATRWDASIRLISGFQAIGILSFALYGAVISVFTIFDGPTRTSVLNNHGAGYAETDWINEFVEEDTSYIYLGRFGGRLIGQVTFYDWSRHAQDPAVRSSYYSLARQREPKFIIGDTFLIRKIMKRCEGRIVRGPFVYQIGTRNPINPREIRSTSIFEVKDIFGCVW